MLLTLDIGNTNITMGLYQAESLEAHWRLATDRTRMPDEYGLQFLGLLLHAGYDASDLHGICMASVVPPLTSTVTQACENYLGATPQVVSAANITNIRILIDEPHSVGADRVVDAVAVVHLYGGPACVVDFGTATTFDAISAEGDYVGGAIAPGMQIGAEALFQRAAKLPLVRIEAPPNVIGHNTVHAMQSGLLFGYVGMVEGMVARFRRQLGDDMKVIATGGLAELIDEHTDVIDIMAPWITLDGLRLIWDLSQVQAE